MKEAENILVQELTQRHGEEKRIRCGWQVRVISENAGQCSGKRLEPGFRLLPGGEGAPCGKEIGGSAEETEETLEPGRPGEGSAGLQGGASESWTGTMAQARNGNRAENCFAELTQKVLIGAERRSRK